MKINSRYISWGVFGGLVLCILFMFFLPAIRVIKDHNHDVVNDADSRLIVKNNVIYLDDREVYRFVPVDGGSAVFGGIDNIEITGENTVVYDYHKQYVESFLIGETPVTKDLWDYVINGADPVNPVGVYMYPHYVNTKDWLQFIEKLSQMTGRHFRLPTKEEWEFAARGGIHSKGFKYAGSDNLDEVAFYKDNVHFSVGNDECFPFGRQKTPNELGLFDMSGGVWELTSAQVHEMGMLNRYNYREIIDREKRGESLSETDLRFKQFYERYVSYGGAFDQPAEACELGSIPQSYPVYTGARLVMDY